MPLIECHNIGKKFAGLHAVQDVGIKIERGEIVGLIGPNGAGKTTFVNLLTGELPVSTGTILYNGVDITRLSPHKRNALGLSRTFQVPRPFRSMSVLENVALAARFGKLGRSHDSRSAAAKAIEILSWVGLGQQADKGTDTLTTAGLKRLEVARALATDPDLLFLDEPLGGLNQAEADEALSLIRAVNERGVTILFIEHIIRAVTAVSHRIMVLAGGKKLAEGAPDDILAHAEVRKAYLGDIDSALERHAKRRERTRNERHVRDHKQ